MRLTTPFIGLLTFCLSLAHVHASTDISRTLAIHEKLSATPHGWHQGCSVPPTKRLRFRVALKQQNAYEFEQHVVDISTPGHPKYGQHMSREDLKRALRPNDEAIGSVVGWLQDEGVPEWDIMDDGDWISFAAKAVEVERIMNTTFHYYTNSFNNATRIRTLQYSVPSSLQQYIQMIQPTTRFGQMLPQGSTVFKLGDGRPAPQPQQWSNTTHSVNSGFNATFCNHTITPACLRGLYSIGNFQGNPKSGNKLGICGYLKQYAKYADLEIFLKTFAPNQNTVLNNFTYVSINGGLDTQNDTVDNDLEANLDVQYAMSLSYLTPTTYYSTGGLGELIPDLDEPSQADDQNEAYLDFLHYILGLPDDELPHTLSISYGEDEQSVPEPYTNATCGLFAQLGARGVSIIFASGDTGVGSACQTNDGKNTTRFLPIFPAACPFVTSVGGTYHVEPEIAIFFSSGGFSDRFPRPSYQDAAVEKYLRILGSQWEGLYNPNGRGFPDVAAQAYNFEIIDQGKVFPVYGTSCGTPTFAAVITLLNSARLSAGKPPLGFLNPWIYQVGYQGLTDIVNGGSTGCKGVDIYSGLPTPIVPYASWNATPGWDPVTGYGTPNFQKLLKLAMAEEGPIYSGQKYGEAYDLGHR